MVSHAFGQRRPQLALLVLAVLCGLAFAGLWGTAEARLDPHVRSSVARLRSGSISSPHRQLQDEGPTDAESVAESQTAAGEAASSNEEPAPEADGEAATEKAAPVEEAAAGAEGGAEKEEVSAGEETPVKDPTSGEVGGAEEGAAAGGEASPVKEPTPVVGEGAGAGAGLEAGAGEPSETSDEAEGGPEAVAKSQKEAGVSSVVKGPADDASDAKDSDGSVSEDAKEGGEDGPAGEVGAKGVASKAGLPDGDPVTDRVAAAEESAASKKASTGAEETEGVVSSALSPAKGGMEVVGRGDEEGPTEVPPDLVTAGVAKAKAGGEEEVGEKATLAGGAEGEAEVGADGEAAAGADGVPAPLSIRKKPTRTITKRGPWRKRKPLPQTAGRSGATLGSDAAPGIAAETGEPAEPTGGAGETPLEPKGEGDAEAADSGVSPLVKAAEAEGAEKAPEEEVAPKNPADTQIVEEGPETVEAAAEDSGNSGVAQEMALDTAGAAAEGGMAKTEVELESGDVPNPPLVAAVGAPEQLLIEQAALEDEEDYASFMSELFSAGQRISPAMQALKEKTAKHVVPTVQEFARSSHAAFRKTTDSIQTHMTPLFGPHASPALATVLSFSLLLLPLLLVGALVYQFRFILTLQRLLVLCNLYLCLYCFALLAACVIISSEPMRSLQAAAEPNFYVLQILEALAYLIYLGLQIWWLTLVSRAKGKDRDPILIAKAVLASVVALGIGLHYYIFVFERALLDKPPKISAWAYLTYTALFGLLTVLGRPKEVKQDVGKQT